MHFEQENIFVILIMLAMCVVITWMWVMVNWARQDIMDRCNINAIDADMKTFSNTKYGSDRQDDEEEQLEDPTEIS